VTIRDRASRWFGEHRELPNGRSSIVEIRLATNTLSNLGNDLQYSNGRARAIGREARLDFGRQLERFCGSVGYCGFGCFGVQHPSPTLIRAS
jgi:tetrahydromethanopterin S-methyltransferase subunit F